MIEEDLRTSIENLIRTYARAGYGPSTSEANIRATLIDPFLSLLGWNILDVQEVDREAFVRGSGFADVKLSIEGRPVAFLEAKRIGGIPASGERTRIELLPEERQAIRYARNREVPWAILTNFERLIVFDADDQRAVLTFDHPQDYLDRLDQLLWLSREKIETSLRWWKGRQRLEPVDLGFLDQLEEWRLLLARDIYRNNRENPVLCDETGTFCADLLMRAVHRLLNRLIIIQCADDKEVLEDHDILRHVIERWDAAHRPYAEAIPLLSLLQQTFRAFDRVHNTTIFSYTVCCDEVAVSDEVLRRIMEEIIGKNFRGFESDILGNTYESYLGHKLVFNEAKGDFEHVESRETRREEGIYYTPPYIVRYIVDHTLGRYLYD